MNGIMTTGTKPTDGKARKAPGTIALGVAMVAATLFLWTCLKAEAPPDPANLRTFIELARSDIKNEKALILAQNMPLTEAEGAEFWPLQREYETELSKLADERLAIIQDYAAHYDTMTDSAATRLANKAFDLERKKIDLKSKYFKKFSKVIQPKKAARFFQIENQLNSAVDLRVAASLPLIK